MGKILLLHLRTLQKGICTGKPGVAGVPGGGFPKLFVYTGAQSLGNGGILCRKIVIIPVVGIILAETAVYGLYNEADRTFLPCEVKGVVSVGKRGGKSRGKRQGKDQVAVIRFCREDFIISLIKLQISEHHKNFSKTEDIFQVVTDHSAGIFGISLFQEILIEPDTVFSVAVNAVSDSEKFLQAGLLHGGKLQKLLQRL